MSAPTSTLPQRSGTVMSSASARSNTMSQNSEEDVIPDEDTSEVTRLFIERLQAYKHACGYLEDYISQTVKLHNETSSQYEKILKQVSQPLKEGHHFEQNLGGISGFFDNLRTNTQSLAQSHHETSKALKSSVLPTFERLHTEIKNKTKELTKGAGKGSKAVDKARELTHKQVELLGRHTASYDSTGGKVAAGEDPYLLYRGTMFRLNKQIQEENANRQDILGVQNNFRSFENHVVQVVHTGLGQLNSVVTKQADVTKSLYGDIVATGQRIPPDFEWINFLHRNSTVLIDPDGPERSIENVTFPNMNHRATIPLISGTLDRKGKLLKRWDTYFYAVTPSKFLHEYKTDDDFSKEPNPEMSLYLPDCIVGQVVGTEFGLKGKDASKNKLGMSMHSSHEFTFKAHTADDAERWFEIIRSAAGQFSQSPMMASPVSGHLLEGAAFGGGAAAAEHAATGHHEISPTQTQHTQYSEKQPLATQSQQPTGTANPNALPIQQESIERSPVEGQHLTQAQIDSQTAMNTLANTGQGTTGHTGTIQPSHLPKGEQMSSSAAGHANTGASGVVTSAGPTEGVSTTNMGEKM